MWKCEKLAEHREEHLKHINKILDRALNGSVWRGNILKNTLENVAFRECGICPGNVQLAKEARAIPRESWERQIEASKCFRGSDLPVEMYEGEEFYPVYTDGSAKWAQSRDTARAGWGVFYGHANVLNKAEALAGPIQSSYRAELRAAVHVLQTAATNVIIVADCKAVVAQLDKVLQGADLPKKISDRDLWEQAVKYGKGQGHRVRTRWMPSHLNNNDKKDKKKKCLEAGLVSELDIELNDEADELAAKGVEKAKICAQNLALHQETDELTAATQYMLVDVWAAYCEKAKLPNSRTSQDDVEELDALMELEKNCATAYPEEDQDPFEISLQECVEEEEDIDLYEEIVPKVDDETDTVMQISLPSTSGNLGSSTVGAGVCRHAGHASQEDDGHPTNQTDIDGFEDLLRDDELQSRFSNYGWISEENEDVFNCNGKVEWPSLKKLYGDKTITIKSNRRGDNGEQRVGTHTIKPTVWEPLLWWLRNTSWTRKASGEGRGLKNHKMRQLCATWVEVALAFQLQTGFKIGMINDDLYAQANCMRVLCQRVWKHAKHTIDGVQVSAEI
jgi:ribonuclease HI